MQEVILSPYGLKFAQGIIHVISNCLSAERKKKKIFGKFEEDMAFNEDAVVKQELNIRSKIINLCLTDEVFEDREICGKIFLFFVCCHVC